VRLTNVANNTGARFRLDWVNAQVHYTPAAPDSTGPVTSNVAAAAGGGGTVTLTANVSDAATGNSSIAAAEYFIDALGANGAGRRCPRPTAPSAPLRRTLRRAST
jgi:hypothetical protein